MSLYKSDQPNLIATQKKSNFRKTRQKLELLSPIDITRGTNTRNFIKPPARIPDPEQTGLVIIVSNYYHKPLSSSQAQTINKSLNGKLSIGSVSSANDSSLSQIFYSLTNNQYEQVKKDYPDGLIVGDDHE